MKPIHKSGFRKKAVARATLREGKGKIRINKVLLSSIENQFVKQKIMEPLHLAGDMATKVDVDITLNGGGMNGQIDAARVALCRALVDYDKKLEKVFLNYDRSFLIPDVRLKETRKPNRHGKARAKRQKSYR